MRNDIILKGKSGDLIAIFDQIKYRSWNWHEAKSEASGYSFASWCVCPIGCLGGA